MASAVDRLRADLQDSAVAQTLAVYIPVSWVILQATDIFVEGLGLPDWVFRGALILLAIGFPIVLLATYAQHRRKAQASGDTGPQTDATPLIGNTSWLTRRRAAAGGAVVLLVWVLIVAGYALSRATGIGPGATLVSSGKLHEHSLLLMAQFDNKSPDATLAETVAEALSMDLSQSKRVRFMERSDVSAALERMEKPEDAPVTPKLAREIALREGANAVLEGSVSALGPATLIRVRLVSAKSGGTIAEFQGRADEADELLSTVDDLSGEIREEIGESLIDLRKEPPLEEVTTSSLPALKLYSRAARAQGHGDSKVAIALLDQALALDGDFPMAWRKLGGLLRREDPTRAIGAYKQAYMLKDRLPEREQLLATAAYQQHVERDLFKASLSYQAVLEGFPTDYTALNNLANIYTTLQRPEQAEPLQVRLVKLEKRFAAVSNLFNTQIRLGKLDAAQQTHMLSARLFPDNKRVAVQPVILALARNDYARADRRFAELQQTKSQSGTAEVFESRYLFRRGRIDEAVQAVRTRIAAYVAAGKAGRALDAATTLVALLRLSGDIAAARAELERALAHYPLEKMDPLDRFYWDVAEAAASVGDAGRARQFVRLAQEQNQTDTSLAYDRSARVAALVALAEGRNEEAVSHLRRAASFGQCANCVHYDLGLAFEASGKLREAVATYAEFIALAPRSVGRSEQELFVLERLVLLSRRLGDPAGSKWEKQLLDRSSQADADLRRRFSAASGG